MTAVEDRVAELKRVKEDGEKRHWQFVNTFSGAVASARVTVVLPLVLASVKK